MAFMGVTGADEIVGRGATNADVVAVAERNRARMVVSLVIMWFGCLVVRFERGGVKLREMGRLFYVMRVGKNLQEPTQSQFHSHSNLHAFAHYIVAHSGPFSLEFKSKQPQYYQHDF